DIDKRFNKKGYQRVDIIEDPEFLNKYGLSDNEIQDLKDKEVDFYRRNGTLVAMRKIRSNEKGREWVILNLVISAYSVKKHALTQNDMDVYTPVMSAETQVSEAPQNAIDQFQAAVQLSSLKAKFDDGNSQPGKFTPVIAPRIDIQGQKVTKDSLQQTLLGEGYRRVKKDELSTLHERYAISKGHLEDLASVPGE